MAILETVFSFPERLAEWTSSQRGSCTYFRPTLRAFIASSSDTTSVSLQYVWRESLRNVERSVNDQIA